MGTILNKSLQYRVTMISTIIIIKNNEKYLDDCISSILTQDYQDFEIVCVVNSSDTISLSKLKQYEEKDKRMKIILNNVAEEESVMKNIGLKYAEGEHVLFLNPNEKLYKHALKSFSNDYINSDSDMFVYIDNTFILPEIQHIQFLNNELNPSEINGKTLFKLLNYERFIIYTKTFLQKNDMKFLKKKSFEDCNLLFLMNLVSSNFVRFTQNNFIESLNQQPLKQKSQNLDISLFRNVIEKFIKNNDIYNNYKNEFWNYIFGSLFNLIYELRDETTKRNYFKDSKLLFDEYCMNKGFYEDIHNSLDIMTWEFFNQTLEDVYYNPIKRITSRRLINENFGPLTIAIKSPHPVDDHTWGDYFFAIALKKSFEKRGFKVVIHELQNWDREDDNEDIVIVLRGLSKYIPKPEHINIMWNISHPEAVSIEEYNSYDVVFISSIKYSQEMDKKLDTVVKPLLQCTDPEVFFPKFNKDYSEDILFVGKTRRVFREIIKDISATSHDFSVYGEGWEQYIDKKFIKGEFIPNNILNQFYSSCNILLNDHWAEMRDLDFPSNRLFDALACGAFIISDDIPSAGDLFENNIVTYKNSKDLDEKIDFYLNNKPERDKKRKAGREIVLANHTFDNRADEIIETLKNITF